MARGLEINDRRWRSLLARVAGLEEEGHVRVGILRAKGGARSRDGVTVLEIAAVHEFGAPSAGIPERSFLRRTFNDGRVRGDLKRLQAKLAKGIVLGTIKPRRALGAIGAWGAAEVKATITERRVTPPIDPDGATAKRKGSTLTLVDEGRLLNSISWVVEDKAEAA